MDSRMPHYFDLTNGQVVTGRKSLKAYLDGHTSPESVTDLGPLLRENETVLPHQNYEAPDTSEWTKEQYIKYGRWLINVVAPPTRPKEKKINEKVLSQSRRLGLGPGVWAINKKFETVSSFYQSIMATETHRMGSFDDWSQDDFIAYVKRVGREEGRRPTRADLEIRSKRSTYKPHPDVVSERFIHIGGFQKVTELAGYMVIDYWDPEDFISWGVKYMLANGGAIPTSRPLTYLSKKDKGPSDTVIMTKFGSFRAFQSLVKSAYEETSVEIEKDRETKLQAIEEALGNGSIPRGLIDEAASEDEMILLYAKYSVLNDLKIQAEPETILKICNTGLQNLSFVQSIRKTTEGAVTAGEIETSAVSLNVFDDIWPMDDYLEDLRLGDEYQAYYEVMRQKRRLRENDSILKQAA